MAANDLLGLEGTMTVVDNLPDDVVLNHFLSVSFLLCA